MLAGGKTPRLEDSEDDLPGEVGLWIYV